MLNGDDNENSRKLIGFRSKTTTLHVQHNYFLLHFFAVVARFMEEMSYVFTNNFLLNFLFSSLCSFSPYWSLAFLIFSPPLHNFHVVLSTKFVFFVFYLLSRSSSFCVIRISVDIIKIQSEKKGLGSSLLSFLSNSPGGHVIYRQNARMLECKLHPGLHVEGGQTCFHAFTTDFSHLWVTIFSYAWCSAIKTMNDHKVRDEVDRSILSRDSSSGTDF